MGNAGGNILQISLRLDSNKRIDDALASLCSLATKPKISVLVHNLTVPFSRDRDRDILSTHNFVIAKGGYMSGQELLIILLVGLIAGWLAGQIMQGTGYGLIADIALGIVGALIGAWLLPQLGIHLGSGIVAAVISATIGALLLLLVLRLVYRGGRW